MPRCHPNNSAVGSKSNIRWGGFLPVLLSLGLNVDTSALHAHHLPLTISFLHWEKENSKTSRSAPKLLTSSSHSTLSSLFPTYRSEISKSHYYLLTLQSKGFAAMATRKPGVIALFDVDGTLTAPRKVFDPFLIWFNRHNFNWSTCLVYQMWQLLSV